MERGLWSIELKNRIIQAGGSIQNIEEIPSDLKPIYKTAWEISMKTLIDMSAERGVFICQSQSFNCFMAEPNFQKLTSMHFYAWKKGLKTGMYYLRTRPAADAIKFTVDQTILKETTPSKLVQSPPSGKSGESERDLNNNNNNNNNNNPEDYDSDTVCPIGCESCGS